MRHHRDGGQVVGGDVMSGLESSEGVRLSGSDVTVAGQAGASQIDKPPVRGEAHHHGGIQPLVVDRRIVSAQQRADSARSASSPHWSGSSVPCDTEPFMSRHVLAICEMGVNREARSVLRAVTRQSMRTAVAGDYCGRWAESSQAATDFSPSGSSRKSIEAKCAGSASGNRQ